MSYTGTEVFNIAIAVLDELSDTGTIVDSQVAEYKNRAPYLLDAWQHEMQKNGDVFKTFEQSFFRKKNLLGDLNHYGIIVENNGEVNTYYAPGANCFYLEVDGDCTITLTENGVPLAGKYIFNSGVETAFTGTISISVPAGTTSFLPLKGILTASGGNVTMAISGTYYFKHNNRALCPYKFITATKVPDFKPWVKIAMPADFKNKTQIIDEYPSWQYSDANNHKWEGSNELYVLFSYEGLIRIKYIPVPVKITALTQTLEVDEITSMSAAYYLCQHFALADQNTDLAAICKNKFAELKGESMLKAPLAPSEIKDFYGIGQIK